MNAKDKLMSERVYLILTEDDAKELEEFLRSKRDKINQPCKVALQTLQIAIEKLRQRKGENQSRR